MKRSYALMFVLLGLAACASGSKKGLEATPDRVVGRSDSLEKRPDWVSETMSVRDKGENYLIIGMGEVPADSRVQAAFKMSDAAARGHLANKLETQVTKLVETSETGLSMEDQSLKSLIRELSQSTFRNVDIGDRYWEKVVKTQSSGEEVMIMKVFSLLKISKSDLKKMLVEQTEKSKQAPKDVRNKVENVIRKQWTDNGFEDSASN